MLESYRPLLWLWAAILSVSAVGVATLQVLGPPAPRGLPHAGTQAVAPPSPPHMDQPAAVASLPPAAAKAPAVASSVLPVPAPAQPSRRRTRSWVRRGAAPERTLGVQVPDDGSVLAERGQSGPLPPLATPSSLSPRSANQHVAGGYIGVFTMGADGTRVFEATP
jgi:hypothetical protein